MTIAALTSLVAPPPHPIHATNSTWEKVVGQLGLPLPQELHEFATTFGSGMFQGDQTTRFWIYNPLSPKYLESIEFECQRLRDAKAHGGHKAVPFSIFPEPGGLLPLAIDDQNVRLSWRTPSSEDRSSFKGEWPIVVMWERGPDGFRELKLGLSQFLVKLLKREIEFECWPEPFFMDNVVFEPLDEN